MSHSTTSIPADGWTLVVLAAGLGRRYRGSKQLEQVGPAGETLADYTLWDARLAGATRSVFVTRPDLVETLRSYHTRWAGTFPIDYVLQQVEDLPAGLRPPPGRARPWGTVQAVLATRKEVRQPFAVINADDFYGREALSSTGAFLRQAVPHSTRFALAGYRLRHTLSPHGGVSRAVLELGENDSVRRIVELREVRKTPQGIVARRDDAIISLSGEELVSMNLWALTPAAFEPLSHVFTEFLRDHGGSSTAECALPDTMNQLIVEGRVALQVLTTSGDWLGLTHSADRETVAAGIRDRVAQGQYPADLFRAARE